jgi:hypothetical protein
MTHAPPGILQGHDLMRVAEKISVSSGSATGWDATGSGGEDQDQAHPACAWRRCGGHGVSLRCGQDGTRNGGASFGPNLLNVATGLRSVNIDGKVLPEALIG